MQRTKRVIDEILPVSSSVFSGATLAIVLWFGNTVVELSEHQTLTEFRLERIEMMIEAGQRQGGDE